MVRWTLHKEEKRGLSRAEKHVAKAQELFHEMTHDKFNFVGNDPYAIVNDKESTRELLFEKLEGIREQLMESGVTSEHTKHRITHFVHRMRGKKQRMQKKDARLHTKVLDALMLIYAIKNTIDFEEVEKGKTPAAKALKTDLVRIGKLLSLVRQGA